MDVSNELCPYTAFRTIVDIFIRLCNVTGAALYRSKILTERDELVRWRISIFIHISPSRFQPFLPPSLRLPLFSTSPRRDRE